ncbi:hypothetical protein AVEN_89794-1 [Araneus ventricosus]|uniref:Cadherin domain-containing protein n=1 Tax=Araneus ventricosus TaxID=182803 RepID=A0A4Y2I2P9_ARAVE|nr:hypothetical protein AVEN_89794-1 [Araneus ventricosus]
MMKKTAELASPSPHTTEVESTIIITNATNIKSPFLDYEPLISVSESVFQLTDEKEVIGSVVVRKRNSSSLPVLFEVEGSDKFAIRYLISPLKEATKAEIFLLQKLDYEKQNLYTLTIYALVRILQSFVLSVSNKTLIFYALVRIFSPLLGLEASEPLSSMPWYEFFSPLFPLLATKPLSSMPWHKFSVDRSLLVSN